MKSPAPRRGLAVVWLLALALAPFAAGCMKPDAVMCSGGVICPAGSTCDEVSHGCINSTEQAACSGKTEQADCTLSSGAPGWCRSGVCTPFFCGDREITGLESCEGTPPEGQTCLDYGFDRGLLGCSSICGPALEGCSSLSWTKMTVPGDGSFNDIWASNADDVYVVGSGGIFHWNGIRWSTAMSDASITHVWGSGPNDVYASGWTTGSTSAGSGGSRSELVHWDGSRWSWLDDATLRGVQVSGIWGGGPNDVYAVGSDQAGAIVHWDGGSWTRIVDPAFEGTSTLFTVWGSGPDHVFIPAILPTGEVDSSGYSNYVEVIEQWDGSAWSQVSSPASIGISSISGSGPDDVFAVGQGGAMHWDGTMWSSLPAAPEQLNAIWAGGPGGVFAVGSTGTVYKWDGRSWTVSYMGGRLPAGGSGTGGIYGVGATVFAGTGQTMLRWDGSTWSPTTPLAGLKGVWASGPDDAYAISDSAISRWDGTSWATVGPGPMVGLNDVWGSGPNDVFVVGAGGTVAHWNGSVWSQTVQQPAYSVLCPNGGGSDIRCQQPPAFDLRRVWGTGSNDVFAVGDGAPFFHDTLWLLHWDGASWSTLWLSTARPFNEDVSGLWASGPHDVFITASDATFHYDGANLNLANLNPMSAGLQTPSFQELWGAGPDDVFAVGAYGTIAHWDGAQWTPMTSGTSQDLMAVNGSGAGDVFAAGGSSVGGALLHLRGGIWEPIRLPGVKDVHGLAVTPRRVFVVGDEGEIHLDRPSVTCVGPERDCHDGWDNDCDGLADADDPDCAGLVTEQCANLADDDGDGKIDCADPDCADFWLCKVH